MRKSALLAVFAVASISSVLAQSVDTIPFRGIMVPGNEVPATTIDASANATILVHVVKDSTGKVVSGSVDFKVNYSFPAGTTFTGLHIHNAPANATAGVVIGTNINATTNSVAADPSGKGTITRQAQISPTDTVGLAALNGILQDPSQYYVNLHTTDFPSGAVRDQLKKADVLVLMGNMLTSNETPPITTLD